MLAWNSRSKFIQIVRQKSSIIDYEWGLRQNLKFLFCGKLLAGGHKFKCRNPHLEQQIQIYSNCSVEIINHRLRMGAQVESEVSVLRNVASGWAQIQMSTILFHTLLRSGDMERGSGLASLQSISSLGSGGSSAQTKFHGKFRGNPRVSKWRNSSFKIKDGGPRPTG